jgi:hypothetical protein
MSIRKYTKKGRMEETNKQRNIKKRKPRSKIETGVYRKK